jgi:hypothetical protein
MWWTLVLAVLGYILAGAPASYSYGGYTITVTKNGSPSHMTWAQAEQAILMILSGQPGSFVSGDVEVTIAKSA